jgi:hypothetical protein
MIDEIIFGTCLHDEMLVAARDTECGVILQSQLRARVLWYLTELSAKTVHNTLNESADDLGQFPLLTVPHASVDAIKESSNK